MLKKPSSLSQPLGGHDVLSRITSRLKKHRSKEGLYIICINASKLISNDDLEQMKESTRTLVKFLLKDPNNWVGVFPLNDEFKYLDKTKFYQKYHQIEAQIRGIQQQTTQPVTILNRFAKGWKKDGKISKSFDTFVVVMSSDVFNPDNNFFKVFTSKKLNLVPCLFGSKAVICKDQTLQFPNAHALHTNFKSLIVKTESLDCRVELFLEYYAVQVKFITSISEPELEIRIVRKLEDRHVPIDAIYTNKKEARIDKLEPGCQYIIKYRFNFSDGLNSAFFEEVYFQTLSQSIRDIELMQYEQAKFELEDVKKYLLTLSISSTEKLMGIHDYNILLFGRIGAGKSSWASTANRAGTGMFNPNFAYVDSSHKSCTKELNKLEVFNCSPISLWDTFGVDDNNYGNNVLENILDGRARSMFKPGDSVYDKEVKLGDCVHAVIIVVDVQLFPEAEELEKLRQYVNRIKNKKHYPILIITKLDTLQPKITSRNMYSVRHGEEIISKAHELFRIDKNNIFFMINYRGEEPQDIYKELIGLRILKKCVERAKQFITQRKKILIKDINGKGKKIIPLVRDDISLTEFREAYGHHITKIFKNEDFYFVDYPEEDEDDVNLNEIDQIDEENGERIKFLTVAKRAKPGNHHHHQENRIGKSLSDSLNSRADDIDMTLGNYENRDKGIGYSQDTSSNMMFHHKSKSVNQNIQDCDHESGPPIDFNLEDSKNEDESLDLSTENNDEIYYKDRNNDIIVEDLRSPFKENKVIVVIDGDQEKELEQIDMGASLHKIRKRIIEQFPNFQERCFTFTKRVEDKELPVPPIYENESAVKLEQVVNSDIDGTAKFYIRSQVKQR